MEGELVTDISDITSDCYPKFGQNVNLNRDAVAELASDANQGFCSVLLPPVYLVITLV
jgi:hypothetical protein